MTIYLERLNIVLHSAKIILYNFVFLCKDNSTDSSSY